jgi:hypothetical protein
MSSLIARLESRFGRWAIPNLTLLIIAGQVAVFLVGFVRGGEMGGTVVGRIALIPAAVMEGEVWRLVTFAFVPPQTRLIFALISWLLLHLFGTSLENVWGSFRFNVYVLIALLANIAATFAVWAIWDSSGGDMSPTATLAIAGASSNGLLYGGIFLAFVRMFPDMIINLFFVLPIRIKWLGILAWIGIAYSLLRGDGPTRLLVLAMILNYLLFFGREHYRELRQSQRRRTYQAKTRQASVAAARHTCLVCGLNSDESPRTLFRYCSQCAGQCGYCPEHIRDHEHVTAEAK